MTSMAFTTNLSVNLSTYTEMQVDITAYSFDIQIKKSRR